MPTKVPVPIQMFQLTLAPLALGLSGPTWSVNWCVPEAGDAGSCVNAGDPVAVWPAGLTETLMYICPGGGQEAQIVAPVPPKS
jgi:hypothetical protein